MYVPVELRTMRKFEDITYEPSREEAAPTPPPRQDSTGQDRTAILNMLACLLACLSTYPSRKGEGAVSNAYVGEIQVQSYKRYRDTGM